MKNKIKQIAAASLLAIFSGCSAASVVGHKDAAAMQFVMLAAEVCYTQSIDNHTAMVCEFGPLTTEDFKALNQ